MPLVLNGVIVDEPPTSTHSLFQNYPIYKETASAVCAQPPKVVGPVGLVYIKQREFAVTLPQDKHITILGTDAAMTCIIAIVRSPGTGAVALGHFDGSGLEDGVNNMVRRVQELSAGYPENRLELHLIGGFHDKRGYSEELAIALMYEFHKQPIEIDLVTACIVEMNNTVRGSIHWPVIYGVGVNVKTAEIFPASFPDRGPEELLRFARQLVGSRQMLDIYDCNVGLLRIGPFNYEPLRGVDLWLQQSDEFILQHLSTSPEIESPHFVMELRAALKHIQDHPFPAITVFPDNRPHYFRKDESGTWIQIRY